MNGFLNINKHSGITSNYILNKLKKSLPKKTKIGHLGTLDPLANGVLPVAIGKATKLFDLMLEKKKTYIATFVFGFETDTLDIEGKTLTTCENLPTKKEIEEILPIFIGRQQQIPPKFSAKNVNGNRAYDLARKGIEFELKSKEIEIFNFDLIEEIQPNTYIFNIECSSGTYIRSIARDLGRKLNSLATMSGLTRTKSGIFTIEKSIDIDNIEIEDNLMALDDVLDFKKIEINNEIQVKALKNGMNIVLNENNCENILIYACQKLLGIGKIEEGYLKLKLHLY